MTGYRINVILHETWQTFAWERERRRGRSDIIPSLYVEESKLFCYKKVFKFCIEQDIEGKKKSLKFIAPNSEYTDRAVKHRNNFGDDIKIY